MKLKKWVLASLLLLGLNMGAAAAIEGVDYEVMNTPMKQLDQDKVEVLEFFAYWCPHCHDLSPIILKHSQTFAEDTYFRTVHVVWSKDDIGYARVAAAVDQAGLKYQATPAIFDLVINQRRNLAIPEVFTQWVMQQNQFDGKKLLNAYNSFINQTQVKQMLDWTEQYNITSTPTVIVGGKYKLLFPKGFKEGMNTIDELVQKVRQERGMKTPTSSTSSHAEKASPTSNSWLQGSLAVDLVRQANH